MRAGGERTPAEGEPPVQVRPGAQAGRPGEAEAIAAADGLAGGHIEAREVGVERLPAGHVGKDHIGAEGGVCGGEADDARGRRKHRPAHRHTNINAGVAPGVFRDVAGAEEGGNGATQRQAGECVAIGVRGPEGWV